MKKWRTGRGETLIETLISLVVIVLGMTMLAGGIVAGARSNKAAEQMTVAVSSNADVGTVTVVTSVHFTNYLDTSTNPDKSTDESYSTDQTLHQSGNADRGLYWYGD